jgi:hypothetical protein
MTTGRLTISPICTATRPRRHVVPGVGVRVGNDVGEGRGVGVTRRVDMRVPAIPSAILRTTTTLMIQAMIRFRFSLELRTMPPTSLSTLVIIAQP